MKTKLIITEYKIKKARRNLNLGMNSRTCPIAQALTQNKILFDVVQSDSIQFEDNEKIFITENMKEFIGEFDSNHSVTPQIFEIDIPEKYFK